MSTDAELSTASQAANGADAAASSSSSSEAPTEGGGAVIGRGKGAKGKTARKRKLTMELAKKAISRPAAKRLFAKIDRPTTRNGDKKVTMRLSRQATDALQDTMVVWARSISHESTRRAKRNGRSTVLAADVRDAVLLRNPHSQIFTKPEQLIQPADA